jgi:1,2-diacylglycerol 3-beta-galactosyltransferase
VPAKVFGFVHNMPELMRAADVIVTKAGPGTICEALACELPIILSGYVPGQEEGNVDFVLNNDVGLLAHDPIELVDGLRKLVKPGSATMRRQVANAKRLSRPYASFDIAHCILSYLPGISEPSIWRSGQILKRRRLMTNTLRTSRTRLRAFQRKLPQMRRMTFLKSPMVGRLTRLRTRGRGLPGRFRRLRGGNQDRPLF